MNLSDIITKCYILALIIRDDGERLLLGDGIFEFKSSLQHFAPNIYQNDVIELQGTDGQLLAGQVRRSAAQSFDGYIADGTITKTDTEQSRRRFLAFFRKKHHYKVVYVMPDGTAVKRDHGYITDAPAVQELYQRFPEYHIALNFEDPNYYEYDENSEGDEIYTHIQAIAITRELQAGLVWDALGAVSDDIAWNEYTTKNTTDGHAQITDAIATAPLSLTHLYGHTEQNGTPTPDAPVAIQTVTGAQTVKITGKNLWNPDNAQAFVTAINNTNQAKLDTHDGKSCLYWTAGAGYGSYPTKNFTLDIKFKENTQYAISYDTLKATTATRTVAIYYTDGTYTRAEDLPSANTWVHQTIISDANKTIAYVAPWYSSGESYLDIDTFQIEEGSTATAYEPYQAQSYTIDLGSEELAKIGTYQDYIWNDDGTWKIHKETAKVVLDGSEAGWNVYDEARWAFHIPLAGKKFESTVTNLFCDKYTVNTTSGANTPEQFSTRGTTYNTVIYLFTPKSYISGSSTAEALSNFKTWLSTHPTTVYYVLATPTDTEITDSELIEQLNHIYSLYGGQNNLWLIPSAGAQGEMTVRYAIGYSDIGSGYHWNEEQGASSNIATNDGIDSVRPLWIIDGPATDPTLTNSTTGQTITWNGTVPADATLTIDMNRQTATLNGANVFAQLEGDWIELAVGQNKLQYSASGGATADSTIEWNGVIG